MILVRTNDFFCSLNRICLRKQGNYINLRLDCKPAKYSGFRISITRAVFFFDEVKIYMCNYINVAVVNIASVTVNEQASQCRSMHS